MTRYAVQRFRSALLSLYLRIAVILTLPLSVLYFLFVETPGRGVPLLAFAMFVLWLQWRTRHDSEALLRCVNWFVLAIMGLMLYGAYIGNEHIHQEIWMMISPIVFVPIVTTRERVIWGALGAASLAAVVMLRSEPLSALAGFVLVVAYLSLNFAMMLLVRHNERNIERLTHLSVIDPLTNVYNRGCLKDVLMSEINRCRRNNQPLTVVMLDIDHFKMFNDSYGHLYGDSVLEQVAEVLRQAAQRAGDYVFRYGGEEFCLVTSGLSREQAGQFVEKLRLKIRDLGIKNQLSPHHHLTASSGFWCVTDLSEVTPSTLLLNADNALYRAKQAGRDAVVDFATLPASRIEAMQPAGAPA